MTAHLTGLSTSDLLSVTPSSGGRVVVAGEVDCSTAPQLAACLESVVASAPAEMVVDLTAVTFLDSAGLHTLVSAHGHAARLGVPMRVRVATRAVLRPIQATGLDQVLSVQRVEPSVA